MTMHVMPVPKNGSCPSGYYSDSTTCMPYGNAKPAIVKIRFCPSGWHADGNYCVAASSAPKNVIFKTGFCPSGFHSDGAYCVEN